MNYELLYITWAPNLEAFHIGSFSVRWYSLCWLIGLALAYLGVRRLFKDQKIPDEKFDPLFIYCFLGILIGARLGHCIFYEPQYYLTSWHGFVEMLLPIKFTPDGDWHMTGYEGLASHGGTLGLILALLLYVRHTKVKLWTVLDNIAIATGTTACFIRLGNLMNSEIVGKVTDVPWAFLFVNGSPDIAHATRHPAQLYEALAYALFFVLCILIYRQDRKKFHNSKLTTDNSQSTIQHSTFKTQHSKLGTGFYFGFCLFYIFLFRFFIEYTKEIQVAFEAGLPLDMGQILSIPFIIIGGWFMWKGLRKVKS